MLNTAAPAPMTIRHNVLQGEYEVSRDPHLVLTTVLGSCIACCLFDPVAKVGGMNHFLLASPPSSREARATMRGAMACMRWNCWSTR